MAGSHMLDMTAWLLGLPASSHLPHVVSRRIRRGIARPRIVRDGQRCVLVHFEAALPPFSKTGAYGNGWEELIQNRRPQGASGASLSSLGPAAGFSCEGGTLPGRDQDVGGTGVSGCEYFPSPRWRPLPKACRSGRPVGPTMRMVAVVDCWIDACYGSASSGTVRTFSLG